jgi:hypothetical protein
MLLEVPAIAAN